MSDEYDYGYCDHCDKYHDDANHPHRRKNNRLRTHESAFDTEDTIAAGETVEFEEV
jgi:hypothetical protein